MTFTRFRRVPLALAAAAALTLGLAGCSSTDNSSDDASRPAAVTVEVEDNNGTHSVSVPPQRVVATDNRTFRTLDEWGITLDAAAVALMPPTVSYKTNPDIVDLGSHTEPDLEAVVAADPDVIVNGQRFTQFHDDLARLVPDATILELDPRDGQPFDEELRRQTRVLGEVFGHEADADKLIADFDAAIARVKQSYDPAQKVMAVITSGGNINYAAPGTGRTLGPVFEVLGLTPALTVADASTNHQGDDISVEAIAASNPDWILVMDRDGAVAANSGDQYTPGNELIANSEALRDVTAVREQHLVYMPQYTYLDEGIQTYTEFFNSLADQLEQQ